MYAKAVRHEYTPFETRFRERQIDDRRRSAFLWGQHLFARRIPAEVERNLPTVTLPDGASIDDLLGLLGIATGHGRPLVSVNHFYCRDNAPLSDGDRIQLLKTVVGG